MAQQIKKKFLDPEVIEYFDDQIVDEQSRAEGQEDAIRSEFADADEAKLLEAKAHAIAQDALKLSEAKEYAELKVAEVKSEIMGGLPETTLDTISEIAAAIASEQTATGSILTQLGGLESSKASKTELSDGIAESKAYTDAQIDAIPAVDLSSLETRVTTAESDIIALEVYSKNIVHVDAVNGVDEIGRGSMLRPFKTINFAYSQVPSLGNPSNTSYNANVGKFVTEKLIIDLAPGRYTENVVLGFKRARVQLRGEGATIIGDVKTSVKLADFPCAALENMKASFPAPFTGVSAFMNIEISGNGGGGLESDPTSSVFVITGQASLAFEESTVAGFGTGLNWDSSHGQFYAYLDSVSVGNWVVTTSYTANMTRALPGGVIEVDSCNIAASSATYRMFFGAVPYSYLTDFATWNVASKGTANLAPNSGLTLKAHNSTFGNVIGPALTLGEIDGCRIYDIDRTMRGTVSNGSIIGSTSTSYLGFINNQFRIFSGSGDLASAYKLGQAVGATRYKMDSVSHTTMSFNRSSSGVLTARALDLGAGVSFDFLDDARSISVADPATNYTRSASTVDASLEGIDNALALKASSASVIAGDAASLSDSKAYTDLKISQIPSVDLSSLETIANVDSKDAAKLVEAKAYADQVSALAQDNAEDYIDSQIAAIPPVDLSNYYDTTEVEEFLNEKVSKSGDVMSGTLEVASVDEPDYKAVITPGFIGVVGLLDGVESGPAASIQSNKMEVSSSRDATETDPSITSVITMGGENLALSMSHREGSGPEYLATLNRDQVSVGEVDWVNSSAKYFQAGPNGVSWFSETLGGSSPDTQPIMPQNPQDLVVKQYVDDATESQQAYSEEVADNALAASKQYADDTFALITDVASIEESLQATQQELSQVSMDAFNAISSETTRATTAESALGSRIDSVISNTDPAALDSLSELVSAFEAADSSLNGAISALGTAASSALGVEVARAIAAEQLLQSNIVSESNRAMLAESDLNTALNGIGNGLGAEISRAQAAEGVLTLAVSSEASARIAADADLQSQHDDLDGYTQDIRSDLDNLDGYAQDIRSDLDAEVIAIDLRLDTLEARVDGPSFSNEKLTVVAEQLSFVELAIEAKKIMSCAVGRLAVHEGEDFDVTVVNGKSRIVWKGSLLSPSGAESIEAGMNVFVVYAY